MARPKWHIAHSIILLIVVCLLISLTWGKGITAFLLVFGFGVLVDIDHLHPIFFWNLNFRKIKNLITGNVKDLELQPAGWVNYLHTWQTIVGVTIFSLIIGSWLPFVSYSVHMVVDGANRANFEYPASPLPKAIHWLYPRCFTYYYNG